MREASRHTAIIAVTMGGNPGLCPVNAGWFSEPFGPPVLQVSSEHLAAIEDAAGSRLEVQVVAHATRQDAQAFNVVSEIRGADPARPPVCVMTPRSGWHANASERGGGLVCWLETMRSGRRGANRRRAAGGLLRTVRFVASSGHELGHLGLHDYLHRHPALAREAYAWIHFGANIGTSTGDTGMTPSDDRLRDAAVRALAPHGLDKIRQSQAAQVAGEAATIREAGRPLRVVHRRERLVPQPARSVARCGRPRGGRHLCAGHCRSDAGARELAGRLACRRHHDVQHRTRRVPQTRTFFLRVPRLLRWSS